MTSQREDLPVIASRNSRQPVSVERIFTAGADTNMIHGKDNVSADNRRNASDDNRRDAAETSETSKSGFRSDLAAKLQAELNSNVNGGKEDRGGRNTKRKHGEKDKDPSTQDKAMAAIKNLSEPGQMKAKKYCIEDIVVTNWFGDEPSSSSEESRGQK